MVSCWINFRNIFLDSNKFNFPHKMTIRNFTLASAASDIFVSFTYSACFTFRLGRAVLREKRVASSWGFVPPPSLPPSKLALLERSKGKARYRVVCDGVIVALLDSKAEVQGFLQRRAAPAAGGGVQPGITPELLPRPGGLV